MKRSKQLRAGCSTEYVPHIISAIERFLTARQLPRVISVDFSDFDELSLLIPHLICRMQRVDGACRPKIVLRHIVIVECIEFSAGSRVRPFRFRPLNIGDPEDIPGLIVLFHARLCPIDILICDLVPYKLRRGGLSIFYFGQFIFGVEWVRGLTRGEKALALRLRLFYIRVRQIVLGFIQL